MLDDNHLESKCGLDNGHQFGHSDETGGTEERKTSCVGSTELGVLGSKPRRVVFSGKYGGKEEMRKSNRVIVYNLVYLMDLRIYIDLSIDLDLITPPMPRCSD